MPRPGPRPYECVKRAWHSDRHQPMRGSIIQQIFRLVTDAHAPSTRKNKEWQEKLPVVVLKAEEIMYSKANSEEEYANVETLWNRVNDAIDTIIRRDESTEMGQFLPPCIEAALNLGCIPVRASRSQRHSNPRTYLTPRIQEPASAPPRTLDMTANEPCRQLPSHNPGRLNSAVRPAAPGDGPDSRATESNHLVDPHGFPFLYENRSVGYNQAARTEANAPLNTGSVYPLYYGVNNQTEHFHLGSRISERLSSMPIIVGTPVGVSISDHGEMGGFQNLFSYTGAGLVSKQIGQANSRKFYDRPEKKACDLSLRLGLSSDPCHKVGKSSSSLEEGRSNGFHPGRNREFCFFPGKKGDTLESYSTKSPSNSQGQTSDVSIRKRKAGLGDSP